MCGQLAVTRGDHNGEAKAHFEAALEAFEVSYLRDSESCPQAAEDTRNCALLCCNLAHLERVAAFQTHDDEVLELHQQRSLLATAISWYEKVVCRSVVGITDRRLCD